MMHRSFLLEWYKLQKYRIFWVLIIMYFLALAAIATSGIFLLEWLRAQDVDFNGIDPSRIPIYDFPDIWQNITWLAGFLKVIPAFIVIISITNDFSHNTLRQNIIDGISKMEYFFSKISLIVALSLASMLLLLITGLIVGFNYSAVKSTEMILRDLEFILAIGLQIAAFSLFGLLLALFIRKSGFVIVGLLVYSFIIEPIIGAILTYVPPVNTFSWVAKILPASAISNLIENPYPRYAFMEIKDYVPLESLLVVAGWITIYFFLIRYMLTKRDIK